VATLSYAPERRCFEPSSFRLSHVFWPTRKSAVNLFAESHCELERFLVSGGKELAGVHAAKARTRVNPLHQKVSILHSLRYDFLLEWISPERHVGTLPSIDSAARSNSECLSYRRRPRLPCSRFLPTRNSRRRCPPPIDTWVPPGGDGECFRGTDSLSAGAGT
jgi:hypothetical protein